MKSDQLYYVVCSKVEGCLPNNDSVAVLWSDRDIIATCPVQTGQAFILPLNIKHINSKLELQIVNFRNYQQLHISQLPKSQPFGLHTLPVITISRLLLTASSPEVVDDKSSYVRETREPNPYPKISIHSQPTLSVWKDIDGQALTQVKFVTMRSGISINWSAFFKFSIFLILINYLWDNWHVIHSRLQQVISQSR